jgi:hypothetical protein
MWLSGLLAGLPLEPLPPDPLPLEPPEPPEKMEPLEPPALVTSPECPELEQSRKPPAHAMPTANAKIREFAIVNSSSFRYGFPQAEIAWTLMPSIPAPAQLAALSYRRWRLASLGQPSR